MSKKQSFLDRYKTGNIPWDANKADENLQEIVREYRIKPCKVLDVGCGTGDNVVWLAQNGFNAIGIDLSDIAISTAKGKAEKAKVECAFTAQNFLTDKIIKSPFQFLFDRGCFHTFDVGQRDAFVIKATQLLSKDGLWLSLMGNCDQAKFDSGPPRLSAHQITKLVEPYFEILLLKSGIFNDEDTDPNRSWICLMKKR